MISKNPRGMNFQPGMMKHHSGPNGMIGDWDSWLQKSALLWLEYRYSDYTITGTRNLGKAVGAIPIATYGNGVDPATFPTQKTTSRGITLNGGNWVDTGLIDVVERTDQFTLFCSGVTYAATGNLMSTRDAAQDTKGYGIDATSTSTVLGRMYHGITPDSRSAVNNTSAGRNVIKQSYAMVVTGATASGIAMLSYPNTGVQAVAIDTLNASIKNGKPLLIGASHNGAAKAGFLTGTMTFSGLFVRALSVPELEYLHRLQVLRSTLP